MALADGYRVRRCCVCVYKPCSWAVVVLSDVNRRSATEAAGLRLFLLPRALRVAKAMCAKSCDICHVGSQKRSKEKSNIYGFQLRLWHSLFKRLLNSARGSLRDRDQWR